MLLGEPPATAYDLNFRVGRVPVRVHPFFWLVTLLMGSQTNDPTNLVIWVAACFASILVHELGHAWAMRACGEAPRVVLYGMGGLAISDGGYARSFGGRFRRGAWRQIAISAAGPGAGFVFAALILLGVLLAGGRVAFGLPSIERPVFWGAALENERLTTLVGDLLFINIAWGIVNLLPIHPLDGGQIARQLFTMRDPAEGVRQSLVLSVASGVAMAFVGFAVWHSNYVGFLFGYLALTNFLALRSPW